MKERTPKNAGSGTCRITTSLYEIVAAVSDVFPQGDSTEIADVAAQILQNCNAEILGHGHTGRIRIGASASGAHVLPALLPLRGIIPTGTLQNRYPAGHL